MVDHPPNEDGPLASLPLIACTDGECKRLASPLPVHGQLFLSF